MKTHTSRTNPLKWVQPVHQLRIARAVKRLLDPQRGMLVARHDAPVRALDATLFASGTIDFIHQSLTSVAACVRLELHLA